MGQKCYTPEQIIKLLREAEVIISNGRTTEQVARLLSITPPTYYR